MCAGREAGIEGETHAVVQRWQEMTTSEPEEREEEEAEYGSTET